MAELQETDKEIINHQDQAQTMSLGNVLQAARTAKQLTQQDISNNLRYSVKQIDALEKGDYHLLPDAMIVRGFIRNYAKLLELDAEPLLACYFQNAASETGIEISVRSYMRPVHLTKESQPWSKYILASVFLLLFVLAWFLYLDYMPEKPGAAVENTAKAVQEVTPPAAEPLPEIALSAAQRLSEEEVAPVDLVADNNAAINTASQIATPAADVKPLDNVTQLDFKALTPLASQQIQAAINASPVKPADKILKMSFTAQTWVSVADKAGKVVYEKILYSGDHVTLNDSLPLNLVIGNASGAKLNFGGKDIDLSPHTKDNVARIMLE